MKKDVKSALELTDYSKIIKTQIHDMFVALPEEALDHGEKYVQAIDYLRKITTSLESIAIQARDYALNQHPDLTEAQKTELEQLQKHYNAIFSEIETVFKKQQFDLINHFDNRLDEIMSLIETFKKAQLTRIK